MLEQIIEKLKIYNFQEYTFLEENEEWDSFFEVFRAEKSCIYIDKDKCKEMYYLVDFTALQELQEIENKIEKMITEIHRHNIFLIPEDTKIKYNTNLVILVNTVIDKNKLIYFEKNKYTCRKIIVQTQDDLILLPFVELNTETPFNDLEFEEKFSEIISKIEKPALKQLLESEQFEEDELLKAIGAIKNEQDENQ